VNSTKCGEQLRFFSPLTAAKFSASFLGWVVAAKDKMEVRAGGERTVTEGAEASEDWIVDEVKIDTHDEANEEDDIEDDRTDGAHKGEGVAEGSWLQHDERWDGEVNKGVCTAGWEDTEGDAVGEEAGKEAKCAATAEYIGLLLVGGTSLRRLSTSSVRLAIILFLRASSALAVTKSLEIFWIIIAFWRSNFSFFCFTCCTSASNFLHWFCEASKSEAVACFLSASRVSSRSL